MTMDFSGRRELSAEQVERYRVEGHALIPGLASADDRFTFNLVLEGRLLTTPPATSFFEGGLGKTRYGHEPRAVQAKLAQAAFLGRFDVRPDLTLRVHANVDAEHNFERRVDVVEALVRYHPAIGDTASLDIRADYRGDAQALLGASEAEF